MRHLWERLKADTPPFWRKVRNLSASALIVVSGLLGEADKVGEEIAHYLRYAFVALTTVAGTAMLTCQDPTKLNGQPAPATDQIKLAVQDALVTELNRPAPTTDQPAA